MHLQTIYNSVRFALFDLFMYMYIYFGTLFFIEPLFYVIVLFLLQQDAGTKHISLCIVLCIIV